MADIKPFCAVRPDKAYASRIAALPYDVYDRSQALAQTEREPLSFLHIDRPETWFDDSVDIYDPRVYEKAGQVLSRWREEGYFIQDEKPCYYIYRQVLDGRAQTGIVACSSVNDYVNGVIKKHENTRASKEQDRIRHIQACHAQTGPIFLAYREDAQIQKIVSGNMHKTPVYDFISQDGVAQSVWIIDQEEDIQALSRSFLQISDIYIADGHHRAASAVKVSLKLREERGLAPNQACGDESDYFLSVLFPDTQLKIMAYNRVIKDLNGLTPDAFIEHLKENFTVEIPETTGAEKTAFPPEKHSFGMYLEGQWYLLKARAKICSRDAVEGLDVSVLQDYVLGPVLGIRDPRMDERIDFVGGIHGLTGLEDYIRDKGWAVAFAMYPTSIQELFAVADSHRLMPPKSTWFEPKLYSGLFIHMMS